jgi:hypothetical protein
MSCCTLLYPAVMLPTVALHLQFLPYEQAPEPAAAADEEDDE